jgi:hypothetical protein
VAVDPVSIAEKVAGAVWGVARGLWQRWRFGGRLEIGLDWNHVPLIVIGSPVPGWRSVKLIVTAPRNSEFVVAKGTVEAKVKGRRWKVIGDLASHVQLPRVVSPNRQFQEQLAGSSIVKMMRAAGLGSGPVYLRFTVEDHHRGRLRSAALACTVPELERKGDPR